MGPVFPVRQQKVTSDLPDDKCGPKRRQLGSILATSNQRTPVKCDVLGDTDRQHTYNFCLNVGIVLLHVSSYIIDVY